MNAISQFSLRMYCFHWNSLLFPQQHLPEVKPSTHNFGKKKDNDISLATEMQLICSLSVLPLRVIPTLLLHGIAREHDFPICSLSLARLISEQPPHCTGSLWSVQWLWFLLLLLKRFRTPQSDQHHFPCHLLKYLPLHCSCTLLSFTLRARQWFLTVFMQWCCKQGGCAELDQLHTQ